MRGERVIVRAFRGQPLLRRIWDVTEKAVYICSEENFRLLTNGRQGLWPVGFPHEDVFQYDPALVHGAKGLIEPDPSLWDQLRHWEEQPS